jgi:heme oxygenase
MPESYFRSLYTDPYAALGAFYVLESLSLGGELIQKHLKGTLNGSVDKLKYFVAQGEDAEILWQTFLRNFSTIAESSDKQENIIDGALRTLRLLDQVMTDESVKV